jgi:hypothetical protein
MKQWKRRRSELYDRKQNVVLLNASHAAPQQIKEKLLYVTKPQAAL